MSRQWLSIVGLVVAGSLIASGSALAQRGGGGGMRGAPGGGYGGGGWGGRGGYYGGNYGYRGYYPRYGYGYGGFGIGLGIYDWPYDYYYGGDYYPYYPPYSGAFDPSLYAGYGPPPSSPPAGYYPPAYAPTTRPTQTEASAQVAVHVPADAKIWFEGSETSQTGTDRLFESPPIPAGKEYVYDIRAQWKDGDREVNQTRHVTVFAGDRATVDFTRPSANEPSFMPRASDPVSR